MAYYDTFVDAWNTKTVPNGANGADITDQMSDEEKLATLNSWTVESRKPSIVQSYQIYDIVAPEEFALATPTNQQNIRDIFSLGTVNIAPGTTADTVIRASFNDMSVTLLALTALQDTFKITIPWYKTVGYSRAFDGGDAAASGVSSAISVQVLEIQEIK